MYRVIILEDDPMVASINRQFLSANPRFSLEGCFSNGSEALAYLREHPVDLAIVDYYMPVMNGMEFIRSCRSEQIRTQLIMITAANSIEEVSSALRQGILDYIIKPFTFERFQQALDKFERFRELQNKTEPHLSQEELDSLLNSPTASEIASPSSSVPKGIQLQTLQMLRGYLTEHRDIYLSSDDMSREIGLSRITIRRYLNYMLENQEIRSMVDYSTGGRPSIRYQKI